MSSRRSSQKLAGNKQIAKEGREQREWHWLRRSRLWASERRESVADRRRYAVERECADKSYPYARPTFYYTDGEPNGVVKEFLEFTLSDAGQKIVEQVGFVPIK
ncbi:MAG: hypothetical protein H0T95_11425 [Chthoniobacterales bacterium]|nr:hypothetical protein [Chthoniobacterales bacterium]